MSGDWVPCQGYAATFVQNGGDPPSDVLLVRPGQEEAFAQGGLVTVLEAEDDVVTQRVIGAITLEADPGNVDRALICERIRVGLFDGAAAAMYADTFFDGPQANEPFLWQRVSELGPGEQNIGSVAHPYWSFLDAKVARKLTRELALFYSVQVLEVDLRVTVRPMLRTWAFVSKR